MKLQGRDLKVDLSGEDVALLHKELALIGFSIPDAERRAKAFGTGTRDAVLRFQKEHGLPTTGVVEVETAKAINRAVPAPTDAPPAPPPAVPADTPPGTPTYVVDGTVASPDRAGVGGLLVRIVDKNVGQDVSLAQATTDARGRYQASFTLPTLPQGKTQPDLEARVHAGRRFLAASDTRYFAGTQETLDVILPAKSVALPSEHESLTGSLGAFYTGRLGELKESGEQRDITYLANKTGWDARAVALAALADQFAQETPAGTPGIKPAFYYALFRSGLPANADTLYRADRHTVERALKEAIDEGVIPSALSAEVNDAVTAFARLGSQKMLTRPPAVGTSSLKDMLTASGLDEERQQRFSQLYAASRDDLPAFWKSVGDALGAETATRLQVDGQLGFLTLNNAALTQTLHKAVGERGISDPVQLAQAGFYSPTKWTAVLKSDVPIPREIPGDTPEAKRANYADYLAAQVRVSYPTAAVAQMVLSGDLPLPGAQRGVTTAVHKFLTEHQGKFDIGVQPVQRYIAQNDVRVPAETVTQVKRLQRAYQITPSDQAMTGLLKRNVDAASHVARYDKATFVRTFAPDVGGEDIAVRIYERSVQISHAVLNIALSYLTARNGLQLGSASLSSGDQSSTGSGQVLQPAPQGASGGAIAKDAAADVIAYPTLEGLFGSMDFCACEHCRSILSPAAYLVDLLLFIDQTPDDGENPQTVLFDRRPDLQHLPLTCENTNTALPYIDVVNETLEYFIANSVQALSLDGYIGHDTGGAASEDLLGSPQFVIDSAYTTLQDARFPLPLPFHRPLESLRRHFTKFEVPLALAMERLRKSDALERGANPYGWRDVLMEEVGFSRSEHEILTNGTTIPLWRMYGLANGMTDADAIAALSPAKALSRRLNITYEDLVALLRTRFVNPNSDLVPKLERLAVPFSELEKLKTTNTPAADAAFDALLPLGAAAPDPADYGGDIKAWVKNQANFDRIMRLITLADPAGSEDLCSFDTLELRYSKPMTSPADTSTRLVVADFVRLLRFLRLWKKTTWTIEQTDAALCAFFTAPTFPPAADATDTVAKLDAGFLVLLPRLGVARRVMKALNLNAKRDLLPLLACWSPISTVGTSSLYRQMFLNPALLKQDAVFADDGSGEFLQDATQRVLGHVEALRSAFNLTGDEFNRIIAALGFDAGTVLTLDNVSAIYRRGWLARVMKVSVRELLLLAQLAGLDPFAPPDPTRPAILRLIALVQELKARSLKSSAALYLIWNQDLSGKSAPPVAQITELARTLRGDFAAIEEQFAATEDPAGDVARARMTLVYGAEAADAFFALLDNTLPLDVAYTHAAATLEAAIVASDPRIAYDDFRHRLSYTGVLTAPHRDALKNVPGVPAAFQDAVDDLFARSEDAAGSFFARYPELKPLYDGYVASADPVEVKRRALLAAFRPALSRLRKRQQSLQRLSAAVSVDLPFAQALLNATGPALPLHAAAHADRPALDDVLALETPGLAVQFFYRDTATGAVNLTVEAAPNLEYTTTNGNALPTNPVVGDPISGIWRGQVEALQTGFFNIVIEADATATVKLGLQGQARPLTRNGDIWRNTDPLELTAGKLYQIEITVERVRDLLRVQWETPTRPREIVPGRFLYPPLILGPFSEVYLRFLKVASLANGLHLTAGEMADLATHPDYRVNALGQLDTAGHGWLNSLPNADNLHLSNPAEAAVAYTLNATLLTPLQALLDFARIKAALSPDDESLLACLQDPVAATQTADSPLFALTRWDGLSLNALLTQMGSTISGLTSLALFTRVYDAFALVEALGISGAALIAATTNEPSADTVRDLQAALRARYAAADWRDLVQPLNDDMRGLQRDALVAYILHQLRAQPATAHIDTADKLFEFFLMDVQMEPCMQTSRIRHALSSVQLFIERCLMNLEPRVSPASIIPKQWEWMKRYRVWEADRKVFLFPENWLEPELRDDKSPIFKEIESELLQSDITDDSAATALLTYLSKLEEVAKLEPVGFFPIPADPEKRTGEIVHVVARTAGALRKYFYRRYEYGYWTPWEAIKLDIEDNPVVPVVWNNRLLLFWLRVVKEGPATSNKPTGTGKLADLTANALPGDPGVTNKAVLCYSEYYNRKWQAARTSDPNRPAHLGGGVSRPSLSMRANEEGDALRIEIVGYSSFLLYNTHSLPVRQEDAPMPDRPHGKERWFQGSLSSTLGFEYMSFPAGTELTRDKVLQPSIRYELIRQKQGRDDWDTPFFVSDGRHAFYVTTTEQQVLIFNHLDYGVSINPVLVDVAKLPPLVLEEIPQKFRPKFPGDGGPIGPDPRVIDPSPMRQFISEDAYIRRGIGALDTVTFGGAQIGPAGALTPQAKL